MTAMQRWADAVWRKLIILRDSPHPDDRAELRRCLRALVRLERRDKLRNRHKETAR